MALGAAALALLLSQAVLRSQADTGGNGKAWDYANVSKAEVDAWGGQSSSWAALE